MLQQFCFSKHTVPYYLPYHFFAMTKIPFKYVFKKICFVLIKQNILKKTSRKLYLVGMAYFFINRRCYKNTSKEKQNSIPYYSIRNFQHKLVVLSILIKIQLLDNRSYVSINCFILRLLLTDIDHKYKRSILGTLYITTFNYSFINT